MSNVQNSNNNDGMNELRAAVGSSPANRLFTPGTFLKSKDGQQFASGKLDPQGAGWRSSITLATCLLIIENFDEFKKSAIEAARMAKRDGETERLIAKENARAAAKEDKPQPKAKPQPKTEHVSDLRAEMDGLAG